jgi:hypothetical protein
MRVARPACHSLVHRAYERAPRASSLPRHVERAQRGRTGADRRQSRVIARNRPQSPSLTGAARRPAGATRGSAARVLRAGDACSRRPNVAPQRQRSAVTSKCKKRIAGLARRRPALHRRGRAVPARNRRFRASASRRARSPASPASRGPPLLELGDVGVPASCQTARWKTFAGNPGKQQASSVERVRLQTKLFSDLLETLQHLARHLIPPPRVDRLLI